MDKRKQQFGKILELSKTMMECAQNGAWEDLGKTEAYRQSLITAFFDEPSLASELEWIELGIHELLRLDKMIVQISKSELDSIQADLQKLQQGKQGINAYQQNR